MGLGLFFGSLFHRSSRRPPETVALKPFPPDVLARQCVSQLTPNDFLKRASKMMLNLYFDPHYQGGVMSRDRLLDSIRSTLSRACREVITTGCCAEYWQSVFGELQVAPLILLLAQRPEFEEPYGLVDYIDERYNFSVVLEQEIDECYQQLLDAKTEKYKLFCEFLLKCYSSYVDVPPRLVMSFRLRHVERLAEHVTLISGWYRQQGRLVDAQNLTRTYLHFKDVITACSHLLRAPSPCKPVLVLGASESGPAVLRL